MTEQLTFDMRPVVAVDNARTLALDERFAAFHAQNGWVADHLERMAADLIARGSRRIGVKMLVETLRYQYLRQTVGADWKLDNSLTSRYARLLLDRRPEWADRIETRALATERGAA